MKVLYRTDKRLPPVGSGTEEDMKKSRFTFIDAIIILLILAAGAVAVIKIMPGILSGGEKGTVKFSVMVSAADEGVSSVIGIGDEVSISFSEKAFAKVTGVSEKEHVESDFNRNTGKYDSQKVEGKSDVIINLECNADISDTEIANGNVPVRVGSEMPVRGKGYTLKGYVIDVDDE